MNSQKLLYRYSVFTTLVAWGLMMFGAYTRLTDAGLGCPDWPACYGQWMIDSNTIARYPELQWHKAWTEMIHRYWAGFLGLCIVGLMVALGRTPTDNKPSTEVGPYNQNKWWIIALGLTLLFQAGLGRWTVTLKLLPIVVMGHLMGGMLIISLLWIISLKLKNPHQPPVSPTRSLKLLLGLTLLMLTIQIALGAWVSANYAALVCLSFPTCNESIAFFGGSEKMTIHMVHRLGALMCTLFIAGLFCQIKQRLPVLSRLLLILLILQIALGIANVLLILPLPIAIAHQGVATLLLLTLMSIYQFTPFERGHKRSAWGDVICDYLTLCKPRVVLLMLVTAWVGMALSITANHQVFSVSIFIITTAGIGLCSAGAAVFNHLIDQEWDAKMQRTQHRPLVQLRISPLCALIFAVSLSILGFGLLLFWINPLTAGLTLCAYMGYAWVYSIGLKHRTPQNIVIGGLAGALPPLLGWVAVSGQVQALAWLPVMIIFAWTPPHFWALAIARKSDYQKAQVPMLPLTHGIPYTTLQMMLYSVLLWVLSLLPTLTGLSGLYYFYAALILGFLFLIQVIRLHQNPSPALGMQTFRFSILYLLLLFSCLLIDRS